MFDKIVIVGGGNMGGAFASLICKGGILSSEQIIVVEKDVARSEIIKNSIGCVTVSEIPSVAKAIVLLAIKPQDFSSLRDSFEVAISKDCLILSIMAGVKIEVIKNVLGNYEKIVRCMPNLALQVAEGMTGYYATKEVAKTEIEFVEKILTCGGKCIKVPEEGCLDAVTALSGSGPAYVFYFMEAVIEASKRLGFSEAEGLELAKQTVKGALVSLEKSDCSCTELRQKVTSKGGTTAAAIKTFDERNVFEALVAGILEAQKRSVELGNIK